MAEQKEDIQTQLYFQPWAVPQQENIKTIIIQQPAKTHMDLNASTDKTAIGSFGFSVLIAVVLGGLATWYAYWCAKKSFQLTEMSFRLVVEEIKSSQQVAMDLNKQLFEQQQKILDIELKEKNKQIWIADVRQKASEYLNTVNKFIINGEKFEKKYLSLLKEEKQTYSKVAESIYEKLLQLNDEAVYYIAELELFSSNKNQDLNHIIKIGNLINIALDHLIEEYKKPSPNTMCSKKSDIFLDTTYIPNFINLDKLIGRKKIIVINRLNLMFVNKLQKILNEAA